MKALYFYLSWALLGIFLCLIGFQYSFVVPKWDAGWYYNCLLNAVDTPQFKIGDLNCFAHISAGFFIVPWALLKLKLGSSEVLIYWNIFTLFVASLSMYGLLRWLTTLSKKECILISWIFAFNPNILSSVFHLNTDFGGLVYLCPAIYFLVSGHQWLAAIFGLLCSFSKETAAAVYGLTVFFYFLYLFVGNKENIARSFKSALASSFISAIPTILFLGRLLVRVVTVPDLPAMYTEKGFENYSLVELLFGFNIFDPSFQSYLSLIFVLSFSWLLTMPILAYVFKIKSWTRKSFFVFFLLCAAVYIVTRFRVYSHPRYVLLALLPVVLFFAVSLENTVKNSKIRLFYLVITFLGIFLSNFKTFDPLSKVIFGTFAFGKHDLLNISSFEHYGGRQQPILNRDELVYNLENYEVDRIANVIFPALITEPRTLIIMSRNSGHYWPPRLDLVSRKITGSRENSYIPQCVDDVRVLNEDPPEKDFYYLDLPFASSPEDLQAVKKQYVLVDEIIFSHKGYELKLSKFAHQKIGTSTSN